MIVYEDIYFGDDDKVIEQRNLLDIVESLNEAKSKEEPFILISSSRVFDRSLPLVYKEDSAPNATDSCGKFLIEAEKSVLSYDLGYVYRFQDVFKDNSSDLERLSNEVFPSFASEEALCLLYLNFSYKTVLELMRLPHKLVHACSPYPFDMSSIWTIVGNGSSCSLDEPPFSLRGYVGHLDSDNLKDSEFYEGFVKYNKKKIMEMLSSLRHEK
jgi:hypothetical protein